MHTPGPWKLGRYLDSNRENLHVFSEATGEPREVACAIGWAGDGADQAGANARLIAAAPDLLAALRVMLEHYASGAMDRSACALSGNSQTDAILRLACSAVRAATGAVPVS